jgi:serine/threonine protein kinase
MSDFTAAETRPGTDPAQRLADLWQQGQRPKLRDFLATAGDLSLSQLVGVLRVDQEQRWRAGERVSAESYLRLHPELAADVEQALVLVYGEYLLRESLGESPALSEYLKRFPVCADRLQQRVEGEQALEPWATLAPPSATVPNPPSADALSMSETTTAESISSAPVGANFQGYEIRTKLGEGGMGVVYRAFDAKHQRLVALKTMQHVEPATLYRFKQEFRSLAGLSHPNLVNLYELCSDGQQWFFTMELVQGVHFLRYVWGPGVVPGAGLRLNAAQLGRLRHGLPQLAAGIQYLHEHGKLHRDIKPRNLLVTPEGRVVLLDFGLAADLDSCGLHQSTEPHLIGTVPYMAPEQAACQPVSPASDWYAFGAILYECFTGQPPFTGKMLQVLLDKQVLDPPEPSTRGEGVPGDLNLLCKQLLSRDPAARPSGPEILNRVGAHAVEKSATPRHPVSTASTPLIGRDRHLQELTDAFEAMRRGRTVIVHVHGRSGVGKSALVECFLDRLREQGESVILAGRCYEQESVPYKALDCLVDALSRHLAHLPALEVQALLPRDVAALARVFPVLSRIEAVAQSPQRPLAVNDPQEVRRRALAALRELLGRLADRQPLILAIDDLQWGDLDSAALLADLLRPPEPPALLLLACYRSEEANRSPFLTAFLQVQEPGEGIERRELAVEALTPEEGKALVLELLGPQHAAAESQASVIAQESGGNPFFVYELIRYLQRATPRPESELTLHEVLWSRVLQLTPSARRLLEVIAVAGRPLPQELACRAAGLGPDELPLFNALRADRLLRSTGTQQGDWVETYHDRIRETVVGRLEPSVLREHHRRLSQVLEASDHADPEVLAVHLQGAGDLPRAGEYYARAAAHAAQTLAFARAAKLYRLALELLPVEGGEERTLRTCLADALANAGMGEPSAREYLRAARGAEPAEALELQRRAALQLLSSGHIDDGLATLRTVLGAVGMRLPTSPRRALLALALRRLELRVRGLGYRLRNREELSSEERTRIDICWSAALGLSMVDVVLGAYFQTRGLLLALRAGEPTHLARSLALEAAHVSTAGPSAQRRTTQLLAAAEGAARQAGDPYGLASVTLARGLAASLAGEWRNAVNFCDEAEGSFRDYCTGVMWELSTAHRFTLWPLMFMGEVAEMARRLPVLLKEAQERDDLYAVTNLSLVVQSFVRLAADEPDRARRELGEVMAKWSQQGFHVQHMNRVYDESQIDLYEGRARPAWDRLTQNWPALVRSHLLHVQQVRIMMLHLRARSALAATGGDPNQDRLTLAAEGDSRALERERVAWALALAGLVRAGLARVRGDTKEASRLLREAAGRCDAVDMGICAQAARRFLGKLLGGDEGKRLVAEADAWMANQKIRRPDRMAALLVPGFTLAV